MEKREQPDFLLRNVMLMETGEHLAPISTIKSQEARQRRCAAGLSARPAALPSRRRRAGESWPLSRRRASPGRGRSSLGPRWRAAPGPRARRPRPSPPRLVLKPGCRAARAGDRCGSSRLTPRCCLSGGSGSSPTACTPVLQLCLTLLPRVTRVSRAGDTCARSAGYIRCVARRAERLRTCYRGALFSAIKRVCTRAISAHSEGRVLEVELRRCKQVLRRTGFLRGACTLRACEREADVFSLDPLLPLSRKKAARGGKKALALPPLLCGAAVCEPGSLPSLPGAAARGRAARLPVQKLGAERRGEAAAVPGRARPGELVTFLAGIQ